MVVFTLEMRSNIRAICIIGFDFRWSAPLFGRTPCFLANFISNDYVMYRRSLIYTTNKDSTRQPPTTKFKQHLSFTNGAFGHVKYNLNVFLTCAMPSYDALPPSVAWIRPSKFAAAN